MPHTEEQFAAALPQHVQTYASLIMDVGQMAGMDPLILYGIGQQETLWGTAKALDVPGPGGTGDHTPRSYGPQTLARLGRHITIIGQDPGGKSRCMPVDGRGWGRGLLQIDWAAWLDWFIAGSNWADARTNVEKGASVFTMWRSYIASRSTLQGDALNAAAISAYNTGGGNVIKSIRLNRSPDATTADGAYSARVLRFVSIARQSLGSA